MEPVTVAFFGISGAGKGTQAELLEKYLKEKDPSHEVLRPEMGGLLRAFMETGTSLAKHTGDIVRAGGLVPSFIPIHLLAVEMNRAFDGSQHVILDGTCRRPDQSRAANDMVRLWDRTNLNVITLTLSPEKAKERLVARGRFDDATDDAIANRFAWYREHVVPAMEELQMLGWKVHEIDGAPDVDTIHQNILSVLGLNK